MKNWRIACFWQQLEKTLYLILGMAAYSELQEKEFDAEA